MKIAAASPDEDEGKDTLFQYSSSMEVKEFWESI